MLTELYKALVEIFKKIAYKNRKYFTMKMWFKTE